MAPVMAQPQLKIRKKKSLLVRLKSLQLFFSVLVISKIKAKVISMPTPGILAQSTNKVMAAKTCW